MSNLSPLAEETLRLIEIARPPKTRTIREFAEQEIIIPNGQYEGWRFNANRQPYAALWLDAVDSNRWRHFASTGATQSGKTLLCCVIPIMYHLFEMQENVLFGLPDKNMANDKWLEDIEPVIRRSRYADLLPLKGEGSRGGIVKNAVRFRNGATLKIISGGGGDKSRSAYTSRVLVITEVDGMDEQGGGSRETNKISQMMGRLLAYGDNSRVYMECTVSIEKGRIWQEYLSGTESKIATKCPHCNEFVTLEREDLHGWESAKTDAEAYRETSYYCNACGEAWNEEDRKQANLDSVLLHRGQKIEDGKILGDYPDTHKFSFRWSSINNLFVPPGLIGEKEWAAVNSDDNDDNERELCQFFWAIPYKPPKWDVATLTRDGVMSRINKIPRNVVPDDTEKITMQIDLHKFLAYYAIVAWREDASSQIIDYGMFDIPSEQLSVEVAMLSALCEFRDQGGKAEFITEGGKKRQLDQCWIDAGYKGEVVYEFIKSKRTDANIWRPSIGLGSGQYKGKNYYEPKKKGKSVRYIGQRYHVSLDSGRGVFVVSVDADHWKLRAHEALATPPGRSGCMGLFAGTQRDHLSFVRQITAEKMVEEFVPGKGVVRKFVRLHRQNHWLDCLYGCCASAHFCGIESIGEKKKPPERKTIRKSAIQETAPRFPKVTFPRR